MYKYEGSQWKDDIGLRENIKKKGKDDEEMGRGREKRAERNKDLENRERGWERGERMRKG